MLTAPAWLWSSQSGTRFPRLSLLQATACGGIPFGRKVLETDAPHPIEIYGVSKWEGEKILLEHKDDINVKHHPLPDNYGRRAAWVAVNPL